MTGNDSALLGKDAISTQRAKFDTKHAQLSSTFSLPELSCAGCSPVLSLQMKQSVGKCLIEALPYAIRELTQLANSSNPCIRTSKGRGFPTKAKGSFFDVWVHKSSQAHR